MQKPKQTEITIDTQVKTALLVKDIIIIFTFDL